MAFSIKQKIRSGTLFLFSLLLLATGVSIYYLVRLKQDSNLILDNNYESIDYAHRMLAGLDSMRPGGTDGMVSFQAALQQQELNVTEPGEMEATLATRKAFEQLRLQAAYTNDTAAVQLIRGSLLTILRLNMAAIGGKNKRAAGTADQALAILGILTAVIVLIGISFTYNFPSIVTRPLSALIRGIDEITRRNYAYRIHLDNRDEFGQVADAFNGMGERLENFEKSNLNRIIFEKTRAEAVINSLKDATIGIDRHQVILFANDQALQLLGIASGEMIGKAVAEISGRNDLFRFLLEEQNNLPFKIVVDQRENYFIKEILEIDAEHNQVIVLRNITSFKELDVAKTNFIATISHELKTPLASSDFSIRLLEDDRVGLLTAEQQGLVQSLRADNQRMLRILSELLNMAQVESGRMQPDMNPVAATPLIDAAIAQAGNVAREKQVRIVADADTSLPMVMADAEKTGWVLNNYLVNAIRHSPAGETITVHARVKDDRVVFEVIDHGEGIAAEYVPRVFDRFFQVPRKEPFQANVTAGAGRDADPSMGRAADPGSGKGVVGSGSGLGLSISREFIEAQGGKVWVTSTVGNGSVFGFDLPISK